MHSTRYSNARLAVLATVLTAAAAVVTVRFSTVGAVVVAVIGLTCVEILLRRARKRERPDRSDRR